MKLFLKIFAAVFLIASLHADDSTKRQQLAENAGALKETLSSVETQYLDGLKNNASAEVARNTRADLGSILDKATWLARKSHIPASAGVNEVLLWRWRSGKDLSDALSDEARKGKSIFRVELEPDAGGDTALFVKRNTELFLQLPAEVHLQMKKCSRQYGLFQDNLKAFEEAGRGKNILTNGIQWRNRTQNLLYHFWALHKGIEWACDYPEEIKYPAYFSQKQAEEIFKLAGCAFYVPKNSALSSDYGLRIAVLTEAAGAMSLFCQRDTRLRDLVKTFQDTEKLNVIWRRWQGKMDYLFCMSGMDGDWEEGLKECLDWQMPFTLQYAAALKKAKDAQAKEDRAARFSKKKADKPQTGEDASDGKKDQQEKVEPPPAPEDPFSKAVYEYNLELFIQSGAWRKDVREVEEFKKDMLTFARILARFRDAAKKLYEQHPEWMSRSQSTGGARRYVPAKKK